MQVRQIMSQPVSTCSDQETLSAAARKMKEHECGVLPVVDRENRVVGIITDRDICMAVADPQTSPNAIKVEQTMTRDVYSCRAEDSLEQAQTRMRELGVRRLPVLDRESKPLGLLSVDDLARHAISGGPQKPQSIELRGVASTLASTAHGGPRLDF
jgi:CBS domain-containing protein